MFIASERARWSRELKTDENDSVPCKHSLSYLVINHTSAVFTGGSTSLKLLPHYGWIIRSAGKLTPAPARLFFFPPFTNHLCACELPLINSRSFRRCCQSKQHLADHVALKLLKIPPNLRDDIPHIATFLFSVFLPVSEAHILRH